MQLRLYLGFSLLICQMVSQARMSSKGFLCLYSNAFGHLWTRTEPYMWKKSGDVGAGHIYFPYHSENWMHFFTMSRLTKEMAFQLSIWLPSPHCSVILKEIFGYKCKQDEVQKLSILQPAKDPDVVAFKNHYQPASGLQSVGKQLSSHATQ